MAFVDITNENYNTLARERAFKDQKNEAMRNFAETLAALPQAYYKIKEGKEEKIKLEQMEKDKRIAAENKLKLEENRFKADQDYKNKMLGLKGQEIAANRQNKMAESVASASKGRIEQERKLQELEVPGYGYARTSKEAADLRQTQADAEDAIKLIQEIKTLGKDTNALFTPKKNEMISAKRNILAGKLRLPLTGPGAMTEDEFNRLLNTMGDPTKLLGRESTEIAKLDELENTLKQTVANKFRYSGIENQNVIGKSKQSEQIKQVAISTDINPSSVDTRSKAEIIKARRDSMRTGGLNQGMVRQ